VSDTVEPTAQAPGEAPAPDPGGGPPAGNAIAALGAGALGRIGGVLARQRETSVLIVVVLLVVYFGFINPVGRAAFFTSVELVNISQVASAIIIIAIGEVFLLICGEIDLSPGYVYTLAPFLLHYLVAYYSVPAPLAILLVLVMGLAVGAFNGFLVVTMGIPSFIATLGTAFIVYGITLVTSHAEQAYLPASSLGIGKWLGGLTSWAQFIWAVVLTAIFYVVLTRTRWGLHTVAAGGNQLGAREAGIHVGRIKYGNFMLTSMLGAFVGLQIAFETNTIDPNGGGFPPMLYAVAAAVLGGTAMLGGLGTILGAFFGALALAVLTQGFTMIGVSANSLNYIVGGTIILAMMVNIQLERLRKAGRR
jgi:simple sugar transport system permease protein